MAKDLSATEQHRDELSELASHAHPEWIMSLDGRRLVDRPRNLREWIRWEIVYFRRRRALRRRRAN